MWRSPKSVSLDEPEDSRANFAVEAEGLGAIDGGPGGVALGKRSEYEVTRAYLSHGALDDWHGLVAMCGVRLAAQPNR